MKKATLLISLILHICSAFGYGLSLRDRSAIDGARCEDHGRVAYLLLIVDRPLEDALTKKNVKNKMLGYQIWAKSEQIMKVCPHLDVRRKVVLVMVHPRPVNALGESVLKQLIGDAKNLGFEIQSQEAQYKAQAHRLDSKPWWQPWPIQHRD